LQPWFLAITCLVWPVYLGKESYHHSNSIIFIPTLQPASTASVRSNFYSVTVKLRPLLFFAQTTHGHYLLNLPAAIMTYNNLVVDISYT
jgi:hypothetical protein